MSSTSMDRREFLQDLAAGGLLSVVTATGCSRVSDRYAAGGAKSGGPSDAPSNGPLFAPAVYLRIGTDGDVTAIVHRSEMGQGSKTTLAMILANELEADWARVRVEQAPGDDKRYGNQDTDGSWSIRGFMQPFREAGATARTMLEQAAAQRWNVPVTDVRASQHYVIHTASGRSLDYKDLVATARTLAVPPKEQLRLKQPLEFRLIGKGVPMADLSDMTVGRAAYGIDQHLPGMKFAVIARPPVYGGRLTGIDDRAARAVPGVERIVRIPFTPPPSGMSPLGGVAVVARNSWAAIRGRNALKLTWHDGPNAAYTSATYRTALERSVRSGGKVARTQGNASAALQRAAQRLSAEYYIPHLAHASMEPPAALASVTAAGCEVWAPSQSPQGARDALAKALGLAAEKVTVHVTLLGGAFGRKSMHDFIIEAALLSRAVGAPVKVLWTREDDLQHDYYHTVAVERLEAGLDENGKVVAWLHRSALPPINSTFQQNVLYQDDGELGMGVTDFPYAIPNLRGEAGPATAHTRIGWLRSVINIPHGFAIASFIDELAHATHRDPKDFILDLLGPDHVIDMARAGITGKPSTTMRRSMTIRSIPRDSVALSSSRRNNRDGVSHSVRDKGEEVCPPQLLTYVASVVQVAVHADGTMTIPRVDVAVDAGFVAHPERAVARSKARPLWDWVTPCTARSDSLAVGRSRRTSIDTRCCGWMGRAPARSTCTWCRALPSLPHWRARRAANRTRPLQCDLRRDRPPHSFVPIASQLTPGAIAQS